MYIYIYMYMCVCMYFCSVASSDAPNPGRRAQYCDLEGERVAQNTYITRVVQNAFSLVREVLPRVDSAPAARQPLGHPR